MFRNTTLKRAPLFGIVFAFLLSFAAAAFTPFVSSTSALTESQMTLEQKALSYVTYTGLARCFKEYGNSQFAIDGGSRYVQESRIQSGDWWNNPDEWLTWAAASASGSYLNSSVNTDDRGGDGKSTCNEILKTGLDLWGYSDGLQLMCAAGVNRADGGPCAKTGGDRFNIDDINNNTGKILEAIRKKVYSGNTPSLYDSSLDGYPARYIIYQAAFTLGCLAEPSAISAGDNFVYKDIKTVQPDGTVKGVRYVGGITKTTTRTVYVDRDNVSNIDRTCSQIAAAMSSYADIYADYLAAHSTEVVTDPAASLCETNPDAEGCTGQVSTSCVLEGIGWIVCPVVAAASKATDALYGWIQNFLLVQPLNINTADQANTTYRAWTQMRNIANVAFVIAFLVIIFSQLTGVGVTNYGIKKTLPRIIVAAILVNISYWVAAIAVDVFNILGNNIYTVIKNLSVGDITITDNVWETVLGWLLAGGAGAGLVLGGTAIFAANAAPAFLIVGVWAAIVFLLGAIIALIVAFAILAVRQALIIMLIVLSPLAFVALLLPNTERYFTMWRKSLLTLLIFYPLFSILFAGSYMAGMIIIGSSGQGNEDAAQGMLVLLGMAVMVVPLALTPMLLKFSTGIMGSVGSMINSKTKSMTKGLTDKARGVRNRKGGVAFGETLGSSKNARNPFGRIYRRVQNSGRTDAQRKKILESQNEGAYLETGKAEELAVKAGQAGQVVSTLEAEHKAAADVARDKKLAYRSNAAGLTSKAVGLTEQTEFEESKSTTQRATANGPATDAQMREVRATQRSVDIEQNRLRSAEGILQQELAEEFKANPGLANYAGGIDPRGGSRVTAAANATLLDAVNKAITAEKSTMSEAQVGDWNIPNPDPNSLVGILKDSSVSIERRAAAVGKIVQTGGDSDIHAALDFAASLQGTEEGTYLQQQISADMGSRKPLSLGAADAAALGKGTYKGKFDDKASGRLRAGKVSADDLYHAGADELERMLKVVSQPGFAPTDPVEIQRIAKLKGQIATLKSNPTFKASSVEIGDLVDQIEARL